MQISARYITSHYKNHNTFNKTNFNFKGQTPLPSQLSNDIVSINDPISAKEILSKNDLKKSINNDCIIGIGSEGLVYRIKDTDYVLKVPHFSLGGKEFIQIPELNFSISEQDKVNHIVAFAGFIPIMNYIKGIPNSNRTPELAKAINNLSINSIKKYYLQLHEATKLGMAHDYRGSNMIINPQSNQITAIDFCDNGKHINYFNDFMTQCNKKDVNKIKLLDKGLQAALELILEEKIPSSEIKLKLDKLSVTDYLNSSESFISHYDKISNLCTKYDENPTIKTASILRINF